jgi:hypothetical protein
MQRNRIFTVTIGEKMPITIRNNQGSTWAKWDLHIHTPNTALSNHYRAITPEEDVWKTYIDKLEHSDVMVFGITDYFGIENYAHLIDLYRTIFPDTEKVFFPNIEFRLETSVGRSAEEVNIHVIFDLKTSLDSIRSWLGQLPTNILENGAYKFCSSLTPKEIEKAAIDHKVIRESLKKVFGDGQCYLIGVAADNQGIRADTRSPRKINIADDIERVCDFIFGAPQNRDYYLRTDRYQDGEKSLMKPVISGCDAHSFDDIDEYLGAHVEEKGKYCTWIKALHTFNGLKQIVFEPESRVAIQQVEPDGKDSYNVIKKVIIDDDGTAFGKQEIRFNKNLNTIIGGKSSGKTLLLYFLAKCIDPEQIKRLSDRFTIDQYSFPQVGFRVEWADGTIDSTTGDSESLDGEFEGKHRITYIPQLYINHLAEKNNRQELNKLIEDILLQDINYKQYRNGIVERVSKIGIDLEAMLNTMMQLREEGLELAEERKSFGSIEAIDGEIRRLEDSFTKLRATLSMTQVEIQEYKELKEKINASDEKIKILEKEGTSLLEIKNEMTNRINEMYGTGLLSSNSGVASKILKKFQINNQNINKLVEKTGRRFSEILSEYQNDVDALGLESSSKQESERGSELRKEIEKYTIKLSKQSDLKALTDQIERNKANRQKAADLDARQIEIQEEYKIVKSRIVSLLKERIDLYTKATQYINEKKHDIGAEIQLSCSLSLPVDDFALNEQVDKRNANTNPLYKKLFIDEQEINYVEIPNFFDNLIRIENNNLMFRDKDQPLPLRQRMHIRDVFRGLINDSFLINYDVTYRGDNLLKMSPGKKGTVLLILFLELSSSQYPIIIDQPEDNLDNRTIYDLLCRMIKEKKTTRQIIIVTHNANLVVTTDSENTIVANQEGQDIEQRKQDSRFMYINGPIELSFVSKNRKEVLYQRGIKQQICDILEGGDEAFTLREKKYDL